MRKDEQGREIRKLRLEANITLEQLAARVGKDFSYLSLIETGLRPMPSDMYWELRRHLKIIAEERLEAVSDG